MDLIQTFDIQDAYRNMMNKTAAPKKSVKEKPVAKTVQPITESGEFNRKYISFDNLINVQDAYASMFNKKVITEDEQVQDIFSTNVETVKAAVEAGGDINTVDKLGDTPLMIAADNGQARDVVKYLISKGADVNKQNKLGSTALLYAVNSETPNAYVIDDLIQAGADVNAVSKTGNSPLGDAKAIGNQDIIDVLTAAGATEEGAPVENPDLSELTDPVADTDTSDLDNSDEPSELDNAELEPTEGIGEDESIDEGLIGSLAKGAYSNAIFQGTRAEDWNIFKKVGVSTVILATLLAGIGYSKAKDLFEEGKDAVMEMYYKIKPEAKKEKVKKMMDALEKSIQDRENKAKNKKESANESVEVKDMTTKPKKLKKTRPISLKKRLRPVRLSVRKPKLQKPVTFKPKYKKTVIK